MTINSIEEYDEQVRRVEGFVDNLESRLPNRRFDFFSSTFFTDLTKTLNEMYEPYHCKIMALRERGVSEREEWDILSDFFSGGARELKDPRTYLYLMMYRHAFDYLVDTGLLQDRDKTEFIGLFPISDLNHSHVLSYTNPALFLEFCDRLESRLNEFERKPNFHKIDETLDELGKYYKTIYLDSCDICGRKMGYEHCRTTLNSSNARAAALDLVETQGEKFFPHVLDTHSISDALWCFGGSNMIRNFITSARKNYNSEL